MEGMAVVADGVLVVAGGGVGEDGGVSVSVHGVEVDG